MHRPKRASCSSACANNITNSIKEQAPGKILGACFTLNKLTLLKLHPKNSFSFSIIKNKPDYSTLSNYLNPQKINH